jgi:uncharacterized protein YjbI with pentapeptide repeats
LNGADFSQSDLSGARLPLNLHSARLKDSYFSYGTLHPLGPKGAEMRGMKDKNMKNLIVEKKKISELSENVERSPSNQKDNSKLVGNKKETEKKKN